MYRRLCKIPVWLGSSLHQAAPAGSVVDAALVLTTTSISLARICSLDSTLKPFRGMTRSFILFLRALVPSPLHRDLPPSLRLLPLRP